MDLTAHQSLSELIQLKSSSNSPQGVAVFGAKFTGDQSLAARAALAQILKRRASANPIPAHPLNLEQSAVLQAHSSAEAGLSHPPALSSQQPRLPRLDESSYPFALSSGELVSFSHSKNRVLIAIAASHYHKLGVDTELKPVTDKLVKRFFTAAESRLIDSAKHKLDPDQLQKLSQTAWMIKEAYGKAAGLGLFAAVTSDLSGVLQSVLSHCEHRANPARGNWTARLGPYHFAGNLEDHWALCTC